MITSRKNVLIIFIYFIIIAKYQLNKKFYTTKKVMEDLSHIGHIPSPPGKTTMLYYIYYESHTLI
jgi:hypothetical protein